VFVFVFIIIFKHLKSPFTDICVLFKRPVNKKSTYIKDTPGYFLQFSILAIPHQNKIRVGRWKQIVLKHKIIVYLQLKDSFKI